MSLLIRKLLTLFFIIFVCGVSWAQPYPSRPIKIVVPFPTGGTSDFTARILAQKLSLSIGQPVVVDNKTGATGTIGADFVAKSTPDGYTLLLTDTSFAIVPGIANKLPYDPIKDFSPIALGIKVPSLLVVNPKLPIQTVKELIDYAKKNPGKVSFGSGGVGTAVHLAGVFLVNLSGADMIHIPYRGAGPAISDVVSGQIQFVIPSIPTVISLVNSGQLRALAITSTKRSDQLPNVPTVGESGYPNYEATSWFGFSAPAGTPRAIVDKLNQEINKVFADKEVREILTKQGAEIYPMTPDQFGTFISDEIKKWAAISKASNVTSDLR
jgi:tripartite-type tricarboxylate transporter receptor subunit TctC